MSVAIAVAISPCRAGNQKTVAAANESGIAVTVSYSEIDIGNAFFKSLGTNGANRRTPGMPLRAPYFHNGSAA